MSSEVSGVFFKICSREFKIGSGEDEPKSKFMKCLHKNQDLILIIGAVILAVLSALIYYGYIPPWVSIHHSMYVSGAFLGIAGPTFIMGVLLAVKTRGCLIVRKNPILETNS